MTTDDIARIASEAGFTAVERDSFYNELPKK
jgi:2-iminoacetate synthase ThiH